MSIDDVDSNSPYSDVFVRRNCSIPEKERNIISDTSVDPTAAEDDIVMVAAAGEVGVTMFPLPLVVMIGTPLRFLLGAKNLCTINL